MRENNPQIATLQAVSLERMEALASALALHLKAGDTLTLRGEVGAGKTSFARALIQAIAVDKPEVTSPTYNLMQSYDVQFKGKAPEVLWHLDLYRIEELSEVAMLGLEEIWRHIVIIEWPEVAASLLPKERLDIAFGFDAQSQQSRSLVFSGNDTWRGRLAALL